MIKKILVPIAFSKYSKGIIKFANGLAEPLGAELLIANIVNERDIEAVERIARFGFKVDSDHYIATIQKERLAEFEKIIAELKIADERYNFVFQAGDPTMELLRLVIKHKIDLVVMGTRAKDIKHIFTGSVAEKMFRKCPISIVFHREGDVAKDLDKRVRKDLKR